MTPLTRARHRCLENIRASPRSTLLRRGMPIYDPKSRAMHSRTPDSDFRRPLGGRSGGGRGRGFLGGPLF